MEIILIRHGKPAAAINPKLSASGFASWVRNYNQSKLVADSLPPEWLEPSLAGHFIVSSDLPRAIDSVQRCLNREPDMQLKQLREMDIPRYKLPFVLKAYTWLGMSRIFWLLGFSGKVESFKDAKNRAKASAELLQTLASQHGSVAFFGHGLLNRYIAKELRNLGWNETSQGKKYWSIITLKC